MSPSRHTLQLVPRGKELSSFDSIPPSEINTDHINEARLRSFLACAKPGKHLSLEALTKSAGFLTNVRVQPMDRSSWDGTDINSRAQLYLQQCGAHALEEYLACAKKEIKMLDKTGVDDEKLAYGAFNSSRGAAFSEQLANTGFRPAAEAVTGFLLVSACDLPVEGLEDNVVIVQPDRQALSSVSRNLLVDAHTKTKTGKHAKKARKGAGKVAGASPSGSAPSFQFAVVGKAHRVTSKMAKLMSDSRYSDAFGGVPVDGNFRLLALSAPLPGEWLHACVGGSCAGHVKLYFASVVYIRPHKVAFGAAARLKKQLQDLPPETARLLYTLVDARPQRAAPPLAGSPQASDATHAALSFDRFLPERLAASEALLGHKCNADQAAVVRGLQDVCHLVHGPPGTGKSTTMFHLINVRVPAGASVLITAVRNAALSALLGKLVKSEQLESEIVVFGSLGRIGKACEPYVLERQIQLSRTPEWSWASLAWLVQRALRASLAEMIALRDRVGPEVAPLVEELEFNVRAFKHLDHVDQAALSELDAEAQNYNPLPPMSHDGQPESLELWAEQLRDLRAVMSVAASLRLFQILLAKRLKMCTVDTAPSMRAKFEHAMWALRRELVSETVALPPWRRSSCLLHPRFSSPDDEQPFVVESAAAGRLADDELPAGAGDRESCDADAARSAGLEADHDSLVDVPAVAWALLRWALFGWVNSLSGAEAQAVAIVLDPKLSSAKDFSLARAQAEKSRREDAAKADQTLHDLAMHPLGYSTRVKAWLQSVLDYANSRGLLDCLTWSNAQILGAALAGGGPNAKKRGLPSLVLAALLCLRPSCLDLLTETLGAPDAPSQRNSLPGQAQAACGGAQTALAAAPPLIPPRPEGPEGVLDADAVHTPRTPPHAPSSFISPAKAPATPQPAASEEDPHADALVHAAESLLATPTDPATVAFADNAAVCEPSAHDSGEAWRHASCVTPTKQATGDATAPAALSVSPVCPRTPDLCGDGAGYGRGSFCSSPRLSWLPADADGFPPSLLEQRLAAWAAGECATSALLDDLSTSQAALLLAAALHTLSAASTKLASTRQTVRRCTTHAALARRGLADLHSIVSSLMEEIDGVQREIGAEHPLCAAALQGLPVQIVLMDEAACMADYCTPVLLTFNPAHLIMVGDPRQLEATSEIKTAHLPQEQGGLKERMEFHARSAMARLSVSGGPAFARGGASSSLLSTQYRMHDSVCSVVSRQFYGGQKVRQGQRPAAVVTNMDVAIQRHTVMLGNNERGAAAQLVVVYSGAGCPHGLTTAHASSYSNTTEAFVALQKAKEAFHFLLDRATALRWDARDRNAHFHGPPHLFTDELGVARDAGALPRVFILTQYARQVRLLRSLLEIDPAVTADIASSFVVQTIDACQGDEADAVIVSLVMAYDRRGQGAATYALSPFSQKTAEDLTLSDFVQYPNRANVAISRMRYHLVVVASVSIMQKITQATDSLWGKVLVSDYVQRHVKSMVLSRAGACIGGPLPDSVPAFTQYVAAEVYEARPQLVLPAAPQDARAAGRLRTRERLAPDDAVALLDQTNFLFRVADLTFVAALLVLLQTGSLDSLAGAETWAEGGGAGALGSRTGSHEQLVRDKVVRVLQEVRMSSELSDVRKRRLVRMRVFGDPSCAEQVVAQLWSNEQHHAEQLVRVAMMAVIDYFAAKAAEGGQGAAVCAAFQPADDETTGAPPAQRPSRHVLQSDACRKQLKQLFTAREEAALPLVSELELEDLAIGCVLKIALHSLGLPDAAVPRWGPVPNLFSGSLDARGRCWLDPNFAGDEAGPMRKPRLFFVQDWPMKDSRWRQLTSLLAPGVQRVLDDVARDPAAERHLSAAITSPGSRVESLEETTIAVALEARVNHVMADRARRKQASRQEESTSMMRLLKSKLPNWPKTKLRVKHRLAAALKPRPARGGVPSQRPAGFASLLVEGVEADDVAAFVTRSLLGSATHAGPILLVTGDSDWLQYLHAPRVHLLDLFGAVKRPEWSLAAERVGKRVREAFMYGTLAERRAAFVEIQAAIAFSYLPHAPKAGSAAAAWLSRSAAESESWQWIKRGKPGELDGAMATFIAEGQPEPAAVAVSLSVQATSRRAPAKRVSLRITAVSEEFLPASATRLGEDCGGGRHVSALRLKLVSTLRSALARAVAVRTAAELEQRLMAMAGMIANYVLCHHEEVLPRKVRDVLDRQLFRESWFAMRPREQERPELDDPADFPDLASSQRGHASAPGELGPGCSLNRQPASAPLASSFAIKMAARPCPAASLGGGQPVRRQAGAKETCSARTQASSGKGQAKGQRSGAARAAAGGAAKQAADGARGHGSKGSTSKSAVASKPTNCKAGGQGSGAKGRCTTSAS